MPGGTFWELMMAKFRLVGTFHCRDNIPADELLADGPVSKTIQDQGPIHSFSLFLHLD